MRLHLSTITIGIMDVDRLPHRPRLAQLSDDVALLFKRPILDKNLMIFCLFAGEFCLPGGC